MSLKDKLQEGKKFGNKEKTEIGNYIMDLENSHKDMELWHKNYGKEIDKNISNVLIKHIKTLSKIEADLWEKVWKGIEDLPW